MKTSKELKGTTIEIESGTINGTTDTERIETRSFRLVPGEGAVPIFNANAVSQGEDFYSQPEREIILEYPYISLQEQK